jgi:1,4-alpha-glucan branching enzyme
MTARHEDGAVSLVLHTHMPYVEGFDTWPFGEEWLWEAMASVYLPLLEVLDGAPVTLGLTPVLLDQLATLDGDAAVRFRTFLRDVRAPIHVMDSDGLDETGYPEQAAEVRRAAADYLLADEVFERIGGRLVSELGSLRGVELWTSSATHAVLPLLATESGVRLQVGAGVASHVARFGSESWRGGFWLPECAYSPGLERTLAERGVRAFCVDQTDALGFGSLDNLEPVRTDAGTVAVPIDWQTVDLIWGPAGYPSDKRYRDYHRKTVHDLHPWNIAGETYVFAETRPLVKAHAHAFVEHCARRLAEYRAQRGRPGVLCAAIDTELLGHWWYEGIDWLREVLAEASRVGLPMAPVSEALESVEPVADRALAASTWGRPKDMTTWDSPEVADFAWAQRDAELRTVRSAALANGGAHGPAFERAARELLALQASDWAFLQTNDIAGDYPSRRVEQHTRELNAALEAVQADDGGASHDAAVRGLAPDLDIAPLLAP